MNEFFEELKALMDKYEYKSLTPLTPNMYIGYKADGQFCVLNCKVESKEAPTR